MLVLKDKKRMMLADDEVDSSQHAVFLDKQEKALDERRGAPCSDRRAVRFNLEATKWLEDDLLEQQAEEDEATGRSSCWYNNTAAAGGGRRQSDAANIAPSAAATAVLQQVYKACSSFQTVHNFAQHERAIDKLLLQKTKGGGISLLEQLQCLMRETPDDILGCTTAELELKRVLRRRRLSQNTNLLLTAQVERSSRPAKLFALALAYAQQTQVDLYDDDEDEVQRVEL